MAIWDVATGAATFRYDVHVLQQDAVNNRSLIRYAVVIQGVSTATWFGGSASVFASISAHATSGAFSWSQGTTAKVILDVSVWVNHAANGTLSLTVGASIGATGTSSIGGPTYNGNYTFTAPTIVPPATKPPAPTSVRVDGATINSLRYVFSNNGSGGSAVLEWQAQASPSSSFASGVKTIKSTGSTPFTGLTPGTRYYFRARGRNAVGWGNWSSVINGQTLPADPPVMTLTPSLDGTKIVVKLAPPAAGVTVDNYRLEYGPAGEGYITVDVTAAGNRVVVTSPGDIWQFRASYEIGTYLAPWTAWKSVTTPNPNTSPGTYFDGSTPARDDLIFAWDGAVGASMSRAKSLAPEGWSVAPGSSGATAIMQRVVGGHSQARSARVMIMTDATTAGLEAMVSEAAAVAEGGAYVASMFINPSRAQRVVLKIWWLNNANGTVGSDLGPETVVPTGEWTRLIHTAAAPDGATKARLQVIDVVGTGHSPWLSGEYFNLDSAMLTIGELYPYFDGHTPETPDYLYTWTGGINGSTSMRTTKAVSTIDPLQDPDCIVVPSAPRPPMLEDDCIDEVGTWRRYWAIISEDQINRWLEGVPTITLNTGGSATRQVRIRVYPNVGEETPDEFVENDRESEQIIRYIPPNTEFVLDGVAQRAWATVQGRNTVPADHLIYGTNGVPATWPILTCGQPYLISFDVPTDAPEGNLSIGIELTRRMM